MYKKLLNVFTFILITIGIGLCYDVNQYSKIEMNLLDISLESDYYISKTGFISDELINNMYSNYKVTLICTDNCLPQYGDLLSYQLIKEGNFILLGINSNEVILSKKVMIGF